MSAFVSCCFFRSGFLLENDFKLLKFNLERVQEIVCSTSQAHSGSSLVCQGLLLGGILLFVHMSSSFVEAIRLSNTSPHLVLSSFLGELAAKPLGRACPIFKVLVEASVYMKIFKCCATPT